MIQSEEVLQVMEYSEFEPLMGAWAEKFKPFIEGEEMFKIYKRLKEDGAREKIFPKYEDVFKSFQLTRPGDIKVVMYCMDPYPRTYKGGIPQATGIPMDCSNSPDGNLQPSLKKFYEGIEKELGITVTRSKSLSYLLEQGVLLLNTELTVKKDKSGSHEGVWAPFQKFFLQEIMTERTGIIYVMLGDSSRAMEKYIQPLGNYVFGGKKNKIVHPVNAAYNHTDWNPKGLFKNINTILKQNNDYKIYWDKKEWQEYSDPPF